MTRAACAVTVLVGLAAVADVARSEHRNSEGSCPSVPPEPTRAPARSKSCPCRAAVSCWRGPAATSRCRSVPNALSSLIPTTVAMSDKLLAAIKTISPLPIRHIVNTSADPDHVGGNERFAAGRRRQFERVHRAGRARVRTGERATHG